MTKHATIEKRFTDTIVGCNPRSLDHSAKTAIALHLSPRPVEDSEHDSHPTAPVKEERKVVTYDSSSDSDSSFVVNENIQSPSKKPEDVQEESSEYDDEYSEEDSESEEQSVQNKAAGVVKKPFWEESEESEDDEEWEVEEPVARQNPPVVNEESEDDEEWEEIKPVSRVQPARRDTPKKTDPVRKYSWDEEDSEESEELPKKVPAPTMEKGKHMQYTTPGLSRLQKKKMEEQSKVAKPTTQDDWSSDSEEWDTPVNKPTVGPVQEAPNKQPATVSKAESDDSIEDSDFWSEESEEAKPVAAPKSVAAPAPAPAPVPQAPPHPVSSMPAPMPVPHPNVQLNEADVLDDDWDNNDGWSDDDVPKTQKTVVPHQQTQPVTVTPAPAIPHANIEWEECDSDNDVAVVQKPQPTSRPARPAPKQAMDDWSDEEEERKPRVQVPVEKSKREQPVKKPVVPSTVDWSDSDREEMVSSKTVPVPASSRLGRGRAGRGRKGQAVRQIHLDELDSGKEHPKVEKKVVPLVKKPVEEPKKEEEDEWEFLDKALEETSSVSSPVPVLNDVKVVKKSEDDWSDDDSFEVPKKQPQKPTVTAPKKSEDDWSDDDFEVPKKQPQKQQPQKPVTAPKKAEDDWSDEDFEIPKKQQPQKPTVTAPKKAEDDWSDDDSFEVPKQQPKKQPQKPVATAPKKAEDDWSDDDSFEVPKQQPKKQPQKPVATAPKKAEDDWSDDSFDLPKPTIRSPPKKSTKTVPPKPHDDWSEEESPLSELKKSATPQASTPLSGSLSPSDSTSLSFLNSFDFSQAATDSISLCFLSIPRHYHHRHQHRP